MFSISYKITSHTMESRSRSSPKEKQTPYERTPPFTTSKLRKTKWRTTRTNGLKNKTNLRPTLPETQDPVNHLVLNNFLPWGQNNQWWHNRLLPSIPFRGHQELHETIWLPIHRPRGWRISYSNWYDHRIQWRLFSTQIWHRPDKAEISCHLETQYRTQKTAT